MNIFNLIFVQPILNLLLLLNFWLSAVHLPFSFGFSIVFLTIIVRLILAPLTASQLKSANKTAELRPKLAELQKQHGADKQALARAQMELYKQHGVNPAAGCLPLILQIPVFIALYRVLLMVLTASTQHSSGTFNHLAYAPFLVANGDFDLNFFGFNLASRPSDFAKAGVQLLILPPLTAILQFWQSKMMMPGGSTQNLTKTDSKPTTEEALQQMQSQMVWLMPAMIGFFSFSFPAGLSLYWNIFTLFGIVQQYWIKKDLTFRKVFRFKAWIQTEKV